MQENQTVKIKTRCANDYPFFAATCLKIAHKEAAAGEGLKPLIFNEAQKYAHMRIEAQLKEKGYIRAMVLKGRQQGISTYTGGRFYWRTTHGPGRRCFIMTHQSDATENLFAIVDRYHQNNHPLLQPTIGVSNAKKLEFVNLDSFYSVSTAGSRGAGRSATIHYLHASEMAFWENDKKHLAGLFQAVPKVAGTEVIIESTANGPQGEFYRMWQDAEAGRGDYIAIFIPWFWQSEYEEPLSEGFRLSDSKEDVPAGELSEYEYSKVYKITERKMLWRRNKIIELGYWKFKQEYPATAAEAFQMSGEESIFKLSSIIKARKRDIAPNGDLVIGIDPSHGKGDPMAIMRRRTRTMYGLELKHKMDEYQAACYLYRIYMEERPRRMFIDVGGGGYAIAAFMRKMEGFPLDVLVEVNFGEAAMDPQKFYNRKAEMYYTYNDWLDDPAGCSIPDEDILQGDMLCAPGDEDHLQRKKIMKKSEVKKKLNRSPDALDAAVLTFAMTLPAVQKVGVTSTHGLDGWPVAPSQPMANTEFDVF